MNWWLMLPRWGCSKCIVKYKKNRLIFYYEVEKKTKKQTHEHELTFSLPILLFWSVSTTVRRTVASCGGLPRSLTTHPPPRRTSCWRSSRRLGRLSKWPGRIKTLWMLRVTWIYRNSHAASGISFCSHLRLGNTHVHVSTRTHIEMHSPVDPNHISFQVKHTSLCVSTPCHEQVFIVS